MSNDCNDDLFKDILLKEVHLIIEGSFSLSMSDDEKKLVILDNVPDIKLGDFSIKCFSLKKFLEKDPKDIAAIMSLYFKNNSEKFSVISEVKNLGPYLNIVIDRVVLFDSACKSSLVLVGKMFEDQNIMVEYLSPNTNKPLHLGHVRNGVLGMSVSNLLKAVGASVIKANLVNNRGAHICKSMLAYQKWGDDTTPISMAEKGDHFVGKYYVEFQKNKTDLLEQEVQQMLLDWENGDPDVLSLWNKMTSWVMEGFSETYKVFGFCFDTTYFESETYKLGKDIIARGIEDEVFFKNKEGTIVFYLPESIFGTNKDGSLKECTVLRADGTSIYITQDIGTAVLKVSDFNLDRSIYLVGDEQKYYFECLFSILKALGYEWANGCYHLSYGMITLPEGRMKSREGTVVDADDIAAEIIELAKEEILKRNNNKNLDPNELEERAYKIGLGAIKFFLLKTKPTDWIEFNPKESISFEGKTGPYCQYAYARASGIMKNVPENVKEIYPDYSLLGNKEEIVLAIKMLEFMEKVENSAENLNPSVLTTYLYDLSRIFNSFYEKYPVVSKDNDSLTATRYSLIKAFSLIIEEGLNLLGIEVLENM